MTRARVPLILMLVMALAVQPVWAISVTNISTILVDPSGALIPNGPVDISFTMDASGDENFTEGIYLSTNLVRPRWNFTILANGVATEFGPDYEKNLIIGGTNPSRAVPENALIRLSLYGMVPTTDKTKIITLVQGQKIDRDGNPVLPIIVNQTATVISTDGGSPVIISFPSRLETFKRHIDEQSALGTNTSKAEEKYREAKSLMDEASSSQYYESLIKLSAAQRAIDDGEMALDRAWAEKTMADANEKIAKLDVVVHWFSVNLNRAHNPQLPAIVAKRQMAVANLSHAYDELYANNYEQARIRANGAFLEANESYTDALALQKEVEANPINSIPLSVGGACLALVCTGLVVHFFMRRNNR